MADISYEETRQIIVLGWDKHTVSELRIWLNTYMDYPYDPVKGIPKDVFDDIDGESRFFSIATSELIKKIKDHVTYDIVHVIVFEG